MAERERERWLDTLEREAAGLVLTAEYDRAAEILRVRCRSAVPDTLAGAAVVAEVAPLLLQGRADGFRPLATLAGPGAVHEGVTLADVCDFVVVRLSDPAGRFPPRSFVLRAAIRLAPAMRDARDDALCAVLLEGADPRAVLRA